MALANNKGKTNIYSIAFIRKWLITSGVIVIVIGLFSDLLGAGIQGLGSTQKAVVLVGLSVVAFSVSLYLRHLFKRFLYLVILATTLFLIWSFWLLPTSRYLLNPLQPLPFSYRILIVSHLFLLFVSILSGIIAIRITRRTHIHIQFFAFIGYVILVTVGIIFMLEIGSRVFFNSSQPFEKITLENFAYAYHPWSHHRATPGFRFGDMSINRFGWRGKERSVKKPAFVKRVILLGDSVAFGSWILKEEATISGYLENILKEKTGEAWEVLNMACPGGVGEMSLAALAHEGIHYAPDVVVALNGANDIGSAYTYFAKGKKTLFPHIMWTIVTWRMSKLYDPRTGRGTISENLKILLNESVFWRHFFSNNIFPDKWSINDYNSEALDRFVKSQIAINYLVKGNNGKFLHFLQPYLSLNHNKIGPNEKKVISMAEEMYGKNMFAYFDFAYPVLREKLLQASQEHRFVFTNLSHLFTAENVFSDHVHFKDVGSDENPFNRKIAEVMAEKILLAEP